jgi:2-polyprenyl-3-methyl-5-hydroxy-6-metoxy-1,4-benzoquinol methylase
MNDSEYDMKIFNPDVLNVNIRMLKEYCRIKGLDFQTIKYDYDNREASNDYAFEMEVHKSESVEKMAEYYSTTLLYLYELTLLESKRHYQKLYSSLVKFAKQRTVRRALDFGGGIGGLTIYLNSIGIKCDYADVPGTTWNYAKHRFQVQNIEAVQRSMEDLEKISEEYDLIITLECLEHLSPLQNYISIFNKLLRRNTYLICKSSFYGIGGHIVSNHKYDSLPVFNELMEKNNLLFTGQLVNRLNTDIVVPAWFLSLLGKNTTSGRSLLYTKQ